jgi:CRP/FNR family transcriptional regulator, anaerobic regulatory protein
MQLLKPTGERAALNRRPCGHCPVRRTGLCTAFAEAGGLPLEDLEGAHLPIRIVQPGDIIYRQGDPADHVYSVVSGWVRLHQDLSDGRQHIGQFLLPGETFGVASPGVHHSQSATALTAASICAIPNGRLKDLRRRHPTFNERFIELLENDYVLATEALTMTAQGSSFERVARILWRLAVRLSEPRPIGIGIALKFPLSQKHIADATGLTAIHVNRVVRRLREQGLAELRDGMLVVEDPVGLAAIANDGARRDADAEPHSREVRFDEQRSVQQGDALRAGSGKSQRISASR